MATLIVYPDGGGSGTTTIDGYASRVPGGGLGEDFATIRAGAGTGNNSGATAMAVWLAEDPVVGKFKSQQRVIATFDTSALGGAVPTAATLSFTLNGKYDGNSYGDAFAANVYSANPASPNAITAADYAIANFGVATPFSTAIPWSAWTVAAYSDFVLNAAGLAAINKSGITKFGVLSTFDATGSGPTSAGRNIQTAVTLESADQSGTTKDPKLTITYPSAGPPPKMRLTGFVG